LRPFAFQLRGRLLLAFGRRRLGHSYNIDVDRSGRAIKREVDDRGPSESGIARMSPVYPLVPCGEHAAL
jgi:hypothetical protein